MKKDKLKQIIKRLKVRLRKRSAEVKELKAWYREQQRLDDIFNRPNAARVIKTDRGAYYEPKTAHQDQPEAANVTD